MAATDRHFILSYRESNKFFKDDRLNGSPPGESRVIPSTRRMVDFSAFFEKLVLGHSECESGIGWISEWSRR